MITLQEFQDLVQIIRDNENFPNDQLIYEYGDWFSTDGKRFTFIDDERNAFEIQGTKLTSLGKSANALGELIKMAQPLGGPPDLARRFKHYTSEVMARELSS